MQQLFEISQIQSNPYAYSVCKPNKAFVKGHFSDQEILPAYSLALLASKCLKIWGDSEKIKMFSKKEFVILSSKFTAPACPQERLRVEIYPKLGSKVEARVIQQDKLCASLFYKISSPLVLVYK